LKLKTKGKNIALSLLGIFLFPVIFQNLHVIRHHHHDIAFKIHNALNKDTRGESFFTILHHKEPCPIVEYKFQINSLPEYFILDSICPWVIGLVIESNSDEPHRILRSSKSPRAPPFSVFG